jgi:hypothetical protein
MLETWTAGMTQISRARRLPSPSVTSIARTASCRPRAQTTGGRTTRKKPENRSRFARLHGRLRCARAHPVCHDPPTNSERIPIRFGRLKALFTALGITRGRAYLDVAPNLVRVRMGWGFCADVPRPSIRSVRRVRNAVSIGVHGWRGRWLVNGASGPLVAIAIDPSAPARVMGFPIRLRELIVSVEDPDAVIAALSPVRAGGG